MSRYYRTSGDGHHWMDLDGGRWVRILHTLTHEDAVKEAVRRAHRLTLLGFQPPGFKFTVVATTVKGRRRWALLMPLPVRDER